MHLASRQQQRASRLEHANSDEGPSISVERVDRKLPTELKHKIRSSNEALGQLSSKRGLKKMLNKI